MASSGQRERGNALVELMSKAVDFWPLFLLQSFAWLEASIPSCTSTDGGVLAPEQRGLPRGTCRRFSVLNRVYKTAVVLPPESPLSIPAENGTTHLRAPMKRSYILVPLIQKAL